MKYMLRRIGRAIPIVIAGTFLTFMLIRLLPGDPVQTLLGNQATTENVARVKKELGLDKPAPVAYVQWLGNAVTGDLGSSYTNNTTVASQITQKLPRSLLLMLYAQITAFAIAIPVGIYSAFRYNRPFDKAASGSSFAVTALPNFILGLLLVYLLANSRDTFFKATGYVSLFEDPVMHFRHMFLPAITLGLGVGAVYTRLLRADMIQTLQEDFITMARAKGMSSRRILFRHALRPSLFSVVTSAGVQIGALVGGAIAVEQIFAIDGIGRFIAGSVLAREYLQVQGGFLVIVLIFVVANLLVELLYGLLDPRVRHARSIG